MLGNVIEPLGVARPAMTTQCRRRRWFQFSLRTLFVVVTALSCWLGWNVHIVNERKAILARMGPDFQGCFWLCKVQEPGSKVSRLRYLLGDRHLKAIVIGDSMIDRFGPDEIERIKATFPEATVLDFSR